MDFKSLTVFLDSLPEKGIPGTDCIIYHKHKEVYRYQSGYADKEAQIPVRPGLLYNLYSATKPVTCVAALSLYEKGLFKLSDPLYAYIPEYKNMYIKEHGEIRPAKNPITIRDLFTMCAGFDYNIRSKSITDIKKATNQKAPTLSVVRALSKEPLSFEPGTRWQYGLSHDVLGGLIEVASGKTLGEYCRKQIFEPLGMKDTSFLPVPEKAEKMAPLYMYFEEKQKAEKISTHNVFRLGSEYESGGGGLISSVDDYISFAAALAAGGKGEKGELILSRGTVELMRTNQLSDSVLPSFIWPQMEGYGYGLGVRTMLNPKASPFDGKTGEFGWGGAAGAYVMMDPDRELSVFYAQHMLESMEAYVHPRLRQYVYEGFET